MTGLVVPAVFGMSCTCIKLTGMQMSARVTLARDGRYVAVARGVLSTMLDGLTVPAEVVDDLQMALGEACTNAVRHASGKVYDVELEIREEECAVEVSDAGPGFSPRGSVLALSGPEAENGRGLALIRALSDEVEFERADDGMRVRFVRRW
jgi:serine/threonine-protein kinase RsbW